MKLIITDLTRFKKKEKVCIAGIDMKTDECIRPMPYINTEICKKYNILPGSIIESEFIRCECTPPHTEDRNWKNNPKPKILGQCSSHEFMNVLERTSYNSVEEGFNITLNERQKYISHENPPHKSIITLRVDKNGIKIVNDIYDPQKLRIHVTDLSGKSFQFLSITDLGFFNYAEKHIIENSIDDLNNFISMQKKVYIRLGLSRYYESNDGRAGFWMQVNGIYTFPNYNSEIRSYQ